MSIGEPLHQSQPRAGSTDLMTNPSTLQLGLSNLIPTDSKVVVLAEKMPHCQKDPNYFSEKDAFGNLFLPQRLSAAKQSSDRTFSPRIAIVSLTSSQEELRAYLSRCLCYWCLIKYDQDQL